MMKNNHTKHGFHQALWGACVAVALWIGQPDHAAANPPVTVLAFRTTDTALPLVAVDGVKPMSLVLKIDRPARPELPGGLALYQVSEHASAPLMAQLRQDKSNKVVAAYLPLGAKFVAAGAVTAGMAGADMQTFDLIVLSNPVAGHEAEYNTWYNTQHISEVLKIPGFESAQRFKLIPQSVSGSYPMPGYAIRFIFHSANLQATADDIKHRLDTGVTHRSPFFDYKTGVSRYYARVQGIG